MNLKWLSENYQRLQWQSGWTISSDGLQCPWDKSWDGQWKRSTMLLCYNKNRSIWLDQLVVNIKPHKKMNHPFGPAFLWPGCHKQWITYSSDKQISGRPQKEKLQYFDFKLLLVEIMLKQSVVEVNRFTRCPVMMMRWAFEQRRGGLLNHIKKYGAFCLLKMVETVHALQFRREGCKGKTFVKCIKCLCVSQSKKCFF